MFAGSAAEIMTTIESVLRLLEDERRRLDLAIAALESLISAKPTMAAQPKRTYSPSARQKIAKTQRIHWARTREARFKRKKPQKGDWAGPRLVS